MRLISANELTTHFNSGRFKENPTVHLTGLGMSFDCPPEYVVVVNNVDEGACWQSDLECVLAGVDPAVDTHRTNPNLLVFQKGLERMIEIRESVMARKAELERGAQIIPLFGRRAFG
jgi:hypothetical protein